MIKPSLTASVKRVASRYVEARFQPPRVLWHGTKHKGLRTLKPVDGAPLWLAYSPHIAAEYAAAGHRAAPKKGMRGELWRVTLKNSAHIVDLSDLSDPVTRAVFDLWQDQEEPITESGWVSLMSYPMAWSQIEFSFAEDWLKERVDGYTLGDSVGDHNHRSLAIFDASAIRSAEPMAPEDAFRRASRTASGYDPESWYYDYETGTPLQTVIDRWQKPRPGLNSRGHTFAPQKVYDHSMPVMLTVRELWPLREYTWSRDKARGGHARIKGKTVNLSGPLKWDALKEGLRVNGWDPKEPLHLEIGAEGGVKVGEGNHRLAIARELRMSKVPVWFHFKSGEVMKNEKHDRTPVEISTKAIENVVEKAERKPMTPEEQDQLDELMISIFGRKATTGRG